MALVVHHYPRRKCAARRLRHRRELHSYALPPMVRCRLYVRRIGRAVRSHTGGYTKHLWFFQPAHL